MTPVDMNHPGAKEGASAASQMCLACRDKLNKRLTKIDILRGPTHLLKIMDQTLCNKCKETIWSAARRGARQ